MVKDLFRRDSERDLDKFKKWTQSERDLQEKLGILCVILFQINKLLEFGKILIFCLSVQI